MKRILVFFLVCSLILTPAAYAWNGDVAARYPEDAEAGVAKTLILVAGVLIGIPLVTWAGRKLMGPSPQEEAELGFKKQLYSSLGERAAERVKSWTDPQIDQMIILGLGGQVSSQPQSQPQLQPHAQTQPQVWQPAPLPEAQPYQGGGGVYLINASQIQEIN